MYLLSIHYMRHSTTTHATYIYSARNSTPYVLFTAVHGPSTETSQTTLNIATTAQHNACYIGSLHATNPLTKKHFKSKTSIQNHNYRINHMSNLITVSVLNPWSAMGTANSAGLHYMIN